MISFIVPAFNEERTIGATLESIHCAAQTVGQPYELIVVDDASTDRTTSVALEHNARVVHVSHRQIAATRNSGAQAANGEILIFIDADTIVNSDVLGAALEAIRGGAVGGGSAIRFDGIVPRYARILLPLIVLMYRLKRLAAGCFIFCTKSAFTASGGFNEAFFGGEEIVFSRALGRVGRFQVLRQFVVTSGRKLRSYSAWELFSALFRIAIQGNQGVMKRQGLDMWYADRRTDPQSKA